MVTRRWLMTSGLASLVPVTWLGVHLGDRDPRITNSEFLAMEKRLGYHLYAPTWLPHPMPPGMTSRGPSRVLSVYGDAEVCQLGLAQERRTPQRDRYHQNRFAKQALATCAVGSYEGYFVQGSLGERRLFFNTPDTAIILSSHRMTDEEMIAVAERLR